MEHARLCVGIEGAVNLFYQARSFSCSRLISCNDRVLHLLIYSCHVASTLHTDCIRYKQHLLCSAAAAFMLSCAES